ncbi:hypothetical protein [Candidatus Mycoplasma haematohominis]|uniref:hypothetical protein n=1 Tax=Candidatus Mycoplasma haematohominis TaxID=1494318 RepID=UPI001C0A75CC|nr:hypothetical protein [Candidatus Mycoplasma haemohominis]
MTPQAAIGTGLGGLAAAGAGGTAVAYAAGAFKGTENKTTNNKEPTYLSQALKENSSPIKEYIGNSNDKIKTLLGDNNTPKYSETLKGAWEKMTEDPSGTSLNKPSTDKDALFKEAIDENRKTEISGYTSRWCEHTANKPLSAVPTVDSGDKNTWDAFNKACFWTKATE